MERRRLFMIVVPLTLVLSAAAFGYSVVAEKAAPPPAPRKAAPRKILADACGSRLTYDRLKAQLFEEAMDLRDGDPRALDLLAGSTVVRVEDPVVQAYDESLGVIVCSGEFIMELPPGAQEGFDGRHRINARIEYAAQRAADGSGPVYRMRGAEPIIYRLAAFGLPLEARDVAALPAVLTVEEEEVAPAVAAIPPPLVKLPAAEVAKQASPPAAKADEKAGKEAPLKKAMAKQAEKPKAPKAEKAAKPVKASVEKKHAQPLKLAVKEKAAKPPQKKAAAVKAKVEKTLAKLPPKKAVEKKPVKIAAKALAKKAAPLASRKSSALLKPAAGQRQATACRASRRSAQILCSNPALAAKERRTTSLYYSALENADGKTAGILRRTAGTFNAYLAGCDSEACVSQAFDGRSREIRDIMSSMR